MSALDDLKHFCKKLYHDEDASPRDFAEMLQILFACTILRKGEALREKDSGDYGVVGARADQQVLTLNNGQFLKFRMSYKIERGSPLTITETNFQYQFDEVRFSDRFVFRYDYIQQPPPNHPQAHLQIKGSLSEKVDRKLEAIKFPVNRPSVESMLRLLITDFGLEHNAANWEDLLNISEKEFLDYQARKRIN